MSDSNRYSCNFGSNPSITASFYMSGPQTAEQVPEYVRKALDQAGVTQVAIFYDAGSGPRVQAYSRIKEKADG
jgi:hypothetical protein